VGDEHGGDPEVLEEGVHLGADLDPQRGVEVGEGLVEEDRLRSRGQRPGQGHPLLLTAGQRRRHPVAEAAEADQLEALLDPTGPPLLAGQPVPDVGADRHVREERPVLEHHPDPTALGRDVDAGPEHRRPADADRAGIRLRQPGDRPQQRGLAASRRSEQGHGGSLVDDQLGVAQDRRVVEDGGVHGHRARLRVRGWHVDVAHAEVGHGVDDCVLHGGRGADGAGLADALGAERVVRRRGLVRDPLERRELGR
jgi:hypothetical protein